MKETNEASISPARVAIVIPANGVNPIEVSKDFPFIVAQIDAPAPKWQVIIFKSSNGLSNNLAAS